jgi:glucose-specific phosphotransferase system IIA component
VAGPGTTTTLTLLSPVAGTVRSLADVPDTVFADGVAGPGLAVEPVRRQHQDVHAPVAGRLGALHPHAFALETGDGRAVLVHLGVDTARLVGQGFTPHVGAGDHVVAGERLLTWSPVDVNAAGLSTLCPVVALQAEPRAVTALVEVGAEVEAGTPLLSWA